MKLRAGDHGEDMLKPCRERGVVIITYAPIESTDLTNLTKDELNPAVKGSARSSIRRFAWEIAGGDEIYIGDSDKKQIVAKAYVSGAVGKRAYRFNGGDAIVETEKTNDAWRHEIPVEWETDFRCSTYKDPAPRHAVFLLKPGSYSDHARGDIKNDDPSNTDASFLLKDTPYMRQTEASLRNIDRLHSSLSNKFKLWIHSSFSLDVMQEKQGIDLSFDSPKGRHLAELKICYGANTRHAIRAALGQIFEYNHYPPRTKADFWWIVLDHKPSRNDLDYVQALRKSYGIPLTVGWPLGNEFDCFPSLDGLIS